MNLPNKLTILRVLMVPIYVILMLIPSGSPESIRVFACIVFCAASFTDFLDGYLARKYKLVTDFGKFMDPLADKLLVCSALICFVQLEQLPAWIVILIIAREFIISGFRLVAADNGIVIAASYFGKFKTVFQMFMIILLTLGMDQTVPLLTTVVIAVALILTVVSLIDYIAKNIKVLTQGGL